MIPLVFNAPAPLPSGGNIHVQPIYATSSRTTDVNDAFWNHYVARIQALGIKPTVARWYVIRAKHYIRTVSQQRLADHTPQDVINYLEKLGRRGNMADWQYR